MIIYFTKKGNCPYCDKFADTARQLKDEMGDDFVEMDCNDPSVKALAKAFGVAMVPALVMPRTMNIAQDISAMTRTEVASAFKACQY